MGSFKGWEFEASAPDTRLNLRGDSGVLIVVMAQRYLAQMDSGQILELLISGGATLSGLVGGVAGNGCHVLKVESLDGKAGLRIWVEKR